MNRSPISAAVNEVLDEIALAETQFGPFNSAHEGYAVLLEEVDELWEHVKTKEGARDNAAMRREAVQVAAMALRFIIYCTDANN